MAAEQLRKKLNGVNKMRGQLREALQNLDQLAMELQAAHDRVSYVEFNRIFQGHG